MDDHIEDLFEAAQPFEAGDLTFHPVYAYYSDITNRIEDLFLECFGGEVACLLKEYVAAQAKMEHIQNLHYFYQGYLAAGGEKTS